MRKFLLLAFGLWMAVNLAAVVAQSPGKNQVRAKNPKFPPSVTDLFSSDARENLAGPRPDLSAAATGGATPNSGGPTTPPMGGGPTAPPMAGGFAWSKLATAEALQNEVKAFKTIMGDDVKTPGQFKSTGSKRARKIFSEYAVLFAVISEYDGEIRWKNQAVAARELFSKCAANCKAATDGAFQETKQRLEDLETLLGGGNITGPADAEAKNNWAKIADRRALMSRVEELGKQLQELTASEAEFKKSVDKISHAAQILSVLSGVCIRPGYEYADDKDFNGYAQALIESCQATAAAAGDKNYDAARKAVGEGSKACANCHKDYRS